MVSGKKWVMRGTIAFFYIVCIAAHSHAQISILFPQSGDILVAGDTITVSVDWTEDFDAPGFEVLFSYDKGKSFEDQLPLQSEIGLPLISKDDDWARHPEFVLRDSIGELIIKVQGYSSPISSQSECCIRVMPTARYLLIERPTAGEMFTIGDTLEVAIDWGELPQPLAHGAGVVVEASPNNGQQWIVMTPLQNENESNPVIDFDEEWAHNPRFIIKDTLSSPWNKDSANKRIRVPAVSDEFLIRAYVRYYPEMSAQIGGAIKVTDLPPIYGQISMLSPQAGDSLQACDTFQCAIAADSLFQQQSPAYFIEYSPDNEHWFSLHPLQFASSPNIPFYADWYAAPKFVIPDTFTISMENDSVIVVSSITDSGSFRVRASNATANPSYDSMCCVTLYDCTPSSEPPYQSNTEDDDSEDSGVCGSGAVSALFIPVWLQLSRKFRRKKALRNQCDA